MEKILTIPVVLFSFLLTFLEISDLSVEPNIEKKEIVEESELLLPPVEIQAQVTGSLPQVEVGYCQLGQSTVTFTNLGMNGDPASSTINDLSLGITLGDAFQLSDGAFEITSIRIAGVELDNFNPNNPLNGNALFASDPDGPSGLMDSDGDGFFDDLELGGSVEITAFYRLDCDAINSISGNCFNDLSTSLNARMGYFEQGELNSSSLIGYIEPINQNTSFETNTDPDAFLGVDTFQLLLSKNRFIQDFDASCGSGGQIEIQMALPIGVSPVLDETSFRSNGQEIPLFSSVNTAGLLVLTFDAGLINDLSGNLELTLSFFGDCTVVPGPSNFPITIRHFCASCNCSHIWFCDALQGPQFHITAPPCPSSSVPSCDKGVQTLSFEANRTTFGFQDVMHSIPFDPEAANRKVGFVCDSVEMEVLGVVGTNPIPDSVGIEISYSNPDGSNSSAETFLFDSGTVRFTHLGDEFICSVTAADLTVTDNGNEKILTFDLNDCLTSLGFALLSGDSIEFKGNFVIDKDGPVPNEFSQVSDFRAFVFVQQSGQVISCDNFGETFWVGKSDASYQFPPTNSTQPSGCDTAELIYRLVPTPNDYEGFFGDEFRPAQKVSSFSMLFDPLLLDSYDEILVEARVPGHPIHGNDYFPIRPLTDFPIGNYTANFDTLNFVPSLSSTDESSFEIRLQLSPNCLAEQNSSLSITSQVIFQDRVYAQNIGTGDCMISRTELGNNFIEYSQPVTLDFEVINSPNDTVQNVAGNWLIQVCNNSSSNAGFTWLAIQNPGQELENIELTNISDVTNPQSISLQTYSEGEFGFLPGLIEGECLILEVKASLSECVTVDFGAVAGWNCNPPNQPNWDPSVNDQCESVGAPLQLTNDLPAPLTIDFQSITSVCNGGGDELVSVVGVINSTDEIDPDDFTLSFVHDENENGIPEPGEVVVSEQIFSTGINPTSPISFDLSFNTNSIQACNILVTVSAQLTDLCEDVIVPLPLPNLINAGEDATFCELTGTTFSTTLGIDECTGGNYTYTWTAISPANASDLSAVNVAQPILETTWANLLGDTLIYILETERLDCGLTSFDTVSVFLPTSPFGYFPTDSIILQADDCQSLVELCLGLSDSELPNIQITNNGLPYPNAALVSCSDTLNAVQLGTGFHQLVVSDTTSGCTDSMFVKVQCSVTDTLVIDIVLNDIDTVCFDNDEIIGAIQTLDNFCEDGSFVGYELFEDSCLILTANWVGSETACIEVCDNIGFCDTTFLEINVLHPLPNGIKDSIVIEQLGTYCFDENLLNIGGGISTINNLCPDLGGDEVDFNLNDSTFCIDYFGLTLGVDTACVEVCDSMGICDTINVCVSVIPGDVIFDTVFIEVDTNVFCLNDSLLPGEIILVEDICPESNGDEVQFSIDGTCISYFGDVVGLDTACIRFEDEFGNVGLINLQVNVVRTIPETICDTVFIGEVRTICLDTSELPGMFTFIDEICPDERTNNVDIFIDPIELCIDYEGLEEGRDSACIIVCDDFGFCDTTYLCLFVAPFFDLPTLGNDTTSTQKGTPVVIDFLANDTLFGGITDIFILDPPISGTAVLNLQNSFTYTPNEPFCARWDNFTYVACNPNGCDTATVSVFIECIELTVFSAVSPNNDGVNDFFFIAKIEDFPDNYLWVYNRWGNLVYEKSAYKNEWPGTWGEDIELPDGTYYYVLEWSDGGNITVQRGYFEMFR